MSPRWFGSVFAAVVIAACTSGPEREAAAPAAAIDSPTAIALGEDGRVAVGAAANRGVAVVGPPGNARQLLGGPVRRVFSSASEEEPSVAFPSGLAFDAEGTLYVADSANDRLVRIDAEGTVSTVRGAAPEEASPTGAAGGEETLSHPSGVAIGPDGEVYVAETDDHRVVALSEDGTLTTVAGSDAAGDEAGHGPEPGFSGDGGPATEARLSSPAGLAVGADGALYIADTGNYRVRRVAADGTITTVAGNGERRFSGDGGPATAAGIGAVRGLAVDADGNLYFSAGHRIRMVAPDGEITTVAGTGKRGCTGDGGPATRARLNVPAGLAVDPRGYLFIADSANGRIRGVTPEGTMLTALAFGQDPFRACLFAR